MIRHIDHFTYLLVISAFVYIPGRCADISVNFLPSENEIDQLNDENFSVDLINEATFQKEMCNATHPCQNAGTCFGGECLCPKDYSGYRCETPAWCTWGKCGYGSDVECVWDRARKKGECRCTKKNYHYLPKDRKCYELDCGDHGKVQVADDVLVCKCDDKYALKSSKCKPCDCGPWSERCSFNSRGDKVCQCQKGYASKTTIWHGISCESCDCGEHGKCSWDDEEKLCDCEAGYRLFGGKCVECNCGRFGTCKLDEFEFKVCTCDYGYAEKEGFCIRCDCNFSLSKRTLGVNCTFVAGLKHCICPPGFEKGSEYCDDINECYPNRPCPANTVCINKPGTFECNCKPGYKPIHSQLDPKLYGCEDIDECSEFPCKSAATRCVNSPGSYDCVCIDGYYATSGTSGIDYKPAHNACYEIETQWREATIALGVILSVAIIGISSYIKKHKSSS